MRAEIRLLLQEEVGNVIRAQTQELVDGILQSRGETPQPQSQNSFMLSQQGSQQVQKSIRLEEKSLMVTTENNDEIRNRSNAHSSSFSVDNSTIGTNETSKYGCKQGTKEWPNGYQSFCFDNEDLVEGKPWIGWAFRHLRTSRSGLYLKTCLGVFKCEDCELRIPTRTTAT